ncbi:MAG: ABC transporter permease subunit [Eubacteriales bacterium]|nr:ABC transporter permease subunit [Eubacteriales bacterium]MDD4511569.1 ABC transporter permease subunit [Eubacteriales bacterium]
MAQTGVVNRSHYIKHKKLHHLLRFKWLYLMLLPAIIYYIMFKFVPLLNLRIIFQKYNPAAENIGIMSPWVDPWYKNFMVFFQHRDFLRLLRNTLVLAFLNICIYFPFPILLALLLNEIRAAGFKRITQSVLYLPHFISWTVLASIMLMLLGPSGLVNNLLTAAGRETIPFMASEQWFRPMYIIEMMWKEAGWGTIIYLAALSGVDEQLYEAAVIDGAGRFKQLLHITLPAIKTTIITLLILRMGSFLDSGFDQIYLMLNSLNREVAEVFDTYIYDIGLKATYKPAPGISNYSYSAAVGVFRSLVGMVMVLITDRIAKAAGEEGVY